MKVQEYDKKLVTGYVNPHIIKVTYNCKELEETIDYVDLMPDTPPRLLLLIPGGCRLIATELNVLKLMYRNY